MIHILYCHQYFNKPTDAGSTRSFYIANALIDAGHDVTIVTSDRSPSGRSLIRKESLNGMTIYWISAAYDNSMSKARKLLAFFNYMIVSSYLVLRIKRYDVIYATSTPLTVGIPALVASLFKRKPYIFEVRDLWPEFPIQMGAIKSPPIIWIAKKLESKIYARAEAIVALSPGMRDGVLKVKPDAATYMVPNMSKPLEFRAPVVEEVDREYFGLSETRFRAVYFGTLGPANNVMHLVTEAHYAQKNGIDIELVFVGDGAMEPAAKAYVNLHDLNNVIFLGPRPMEEVTKIVSICDVSIISFTGHPVLQTNSPNKFFDSLSASKPCIVNVNGWIRDLVEEYDCGCYADPDIEGALANILYDYKQSSEKIARQSANAYELCLSRFDRETLCHQIVEIVQDRLSSTSK